MSTVEVRLPGFRDVVGEDVAFEKLGTGFLFTEGPVWDPIEQHLTFSDMPGDVMRRWDHVRGVRTLRQPCNKSNGIAYDRQGRMLVCEHATSTVSRLDADGARTVLASRWDGKELNSPNDIVCRSDGAIYFSDPTYGRAEYYGLPRPQQLSFQGVYRIDPATGAIALLANDFGQPNGLCFSQDEKRLFVNDTDRQHIRVFDVAGDGSLANGRVWAETRGEGAGAPDGMKIDLLGNVYCCGPGGIHVFDAEARCLGVIRVPEYTANFCWGDGDYRSLFITAATSLYRIRTRIPGRPIY
ncbi:MAG TPA: SMP-30/gluconolactonase/LRE family protein [Hyphomicrobiaceae bacterium]|nr:SMP-30/gluconolactonase/LRE family protein [Hyphomicrobiaceae bacterium]